MRTLLFVLGLLICGPMGPTQVQAASLRSVTTLHGPNVYLKDLFDDAGVNADRVLGPGPDPGGRIVVEAAQLSAIARQYNVSWRSVSRADRAVLEWPGRPMRREEAIEAIRQAMNVGGTPDEVEIDLPGFTPPIIPADAVSAATVSQLDYDTNTGRFTAALTVTIEGMNPIDTRVGGRVEQVVLVPVTLTRLAPDTVLRAEDIRMSRVRAGVLQNEVARSVDQVVGMQLRHPAAAGQPLRLAELMRPPLVQRGATVRIELSAGGLSVTGQAVALDDGADGEQIRVQNQTSHAFLFAQVVGPGQVRVTPDAPAALPAAPARFEHRISQ
jgi:flagella basal body P-ring formation protein FlgA